ncbi:MAG: hypothetical protein AABZ61_02990 [Bacteroidota bacterium]|jgi:hypothetical protein
MNEVNKEGKGWVIVPEGTANTLLLLRDFGAEYADERNGSSSEDCSRKAV